jgi:hypothetical protein
MVYIPSGAYQTGEDDEDIMGLHTARVKTVSVPASSLRTYQAAPPLPDTAVQSFAALAHTLAVTPGNAGLVNALNKLVSKRRR